MSKNHKIKVNYLLQKWAVSHFFLIISNTSVKFCMLITFVFQLIISVTFNQSVKIHSLKIKAPADKGPKFIRLFINQPRTLDFDSADNCYSVQDLE